MQLDPAPEPNPYAPPTSDVDGALKLGDTAQQVLAERSARARAALIDILLCLPAALSGILVLGIALGIGSGLGIAAAAAAQHPSETLARVGAGLGCIALLIYQWTLVVRSGQSLGKRWLRLRIVKLDGSPVTFNRGVLLRSGVTLIITSIPYLGSAFLLLDILPIFGEKRRCLHDYIAGTKVIVA
jgi:uncharacterized RDD family membrane protein YckC